MVIGVGLNAPVLQLPSEVCMRPCDTVTKCPLPCTFHRSFKMFTISTSEFGTMGYADECEHVSDEFLAMVTEGVVHSVFKVVTRLPLVT